MARELVERELLDDPRSATLAEIEGNLRDIELANRWLGGRSVVLGHLRGFISGCKARQPIKILDMATGAADIPISIVQWAKEKNIAVQITAVDKNPMVVRLARDRTRGYPEIHVDEQDILHLPYPDGGFHYAICSQILHHLTDQDVIALLRTANRLSTDGVIASDLRRSSLCIALASVGSRLVTNRLSAHDGRVSFHNAFTAEELRGLAELAGLPAFRVCRHGPCRLALVVDKRSTIRSLERGCTKEARAFMVLA